MRKKLFTLLLCCLVPSLAFGAPLRACLIESSGAVVIKRRCNESKGQVTLSSAVLSGLATTQVGPKGDQGPTGPQGPQGVQGAVGPQGPVGPSDVLVKTNEFTSVNNCSDDSLATCSDVALLTLSEGDWLVIAKFNLDSNAGFAASPLNRCGLMQDGVKIDEVRTSLNANNQTGQGEVVILMQTISGAAAGTEVSLRCEEEAGESNNVEDLVFSALKVGAVTVQ